MVTDRYKEFRRTKQHEVPYFYSCIDIRIRLIHNYFFNFAIQQFLFHCSNFTTVWFVGTEKEISL